MTSNQQAPDPSMMMASKKDIQDLMEVNLEILSLMKGKSIAEIKGEEEWLPTTQAMKKLNVGSHTTLANWKKKGLIKARPRGVKGWEYDVRSYRRNGIVIS